MTAQEYGQTLNPKVGESAARRKLEQMVKEGKMKRVVGVRTLPNGGRTKTIDYKEV